MPVYKNKKQKKTVKIIINFTLLSLRALRLPKTDTYNSPIA